MIEVGTRGKWYTLNDKVVKPNEFYGIDAFKFVNHIWAWVKGGHGGEGGGVHLTRAKRYIEKEVIGNGCKRMRAPVEVMFWGPPYFDLSPNNPAPYNLPNIANETSLVNLRVGTGSGFSLTRGFQKVVRMYVNLAREFDIVIEVPWLWTIKGKADRASLNRLELGNEDPRIRFKKDNVGGVSIWNEHYLAAHGVGAYLHLLKTRGDGDGNSRCDPGPLNLIHDAANEFTVHADVWNSNQLASIARRFHDRDAPGEILLISESGPADTYRPALRSQTGSSGYEGPCIHPPRSPSGGLDWDKQGNISRTRWPNELIDFNESQLGLTQQQRDFWVPQIPKWAGLGSTNMTKWRRMHENFVENDIYTTFHNFRGMDAGWPETPQTVVEETIRDITGSQQPPPPPPPPPPPENLRYAGQIQHDWNLILGHSLNNKDVMRERNELYRQFYEGDIERGLSKAQHQDLLIRSDEFRKKNRG